MSFNAALHSVMPRLPVSWKEFSELLRTNYADDLDNDPHRRIEKVAKAQFNAVSEGSHDRAADEQLFGNPSGSWKATYSVGGDASEDSDASPSGAEYEGFEAFA